jgi:serine/threonine-protein kinase
LSRTLGRYRLERRLGEGGMGDVHAAVVLEGDGAGRRVCVKVMKPALATNPRAVDLFLREARHASRLRHPRIVRILELGRHDDTWFLAMELLDGLAWHDLAQRCWRHGVEIPLEVIVGAAVDAAGALHYAHTLRDDDGRAAGIVHRDISPDNLFLCRDGATRVLDFGIAKKTAPDATSLTEMGELRGKLPYMPPEQLRSNSVGAAADLWALGVTLFYLSTAQRPFDRVTPVAIMKAIEHEPAVSALTMNPHLPSTFAAVIDRCLQKDPAARFSSAAALRDALLALLPRPPDVAEARMLLAHAGSLEAGDRRPMTAHAARPAWSPWPALPVLHRDTAGSGDIDEGIAEEIDQGIDEEGTTQTWSSADESLFTTEQFAVPQPAITADESDIGPLDNARRARARVVEPEDERTVPIAIEESRASRASLAEQTSTVALPIARGPPAATMRRARPRMIPVWIFAVGGFVVTVAVAALIAMWALQRG